MLLNYTTELRMSVEARIWAHKRFPAMMREKSVLMILADRHNEKRGFAWPSHASIARDGCMSTTTVKRAITGLVQQGLVAVRAQSYERNDSYASNRYYLQGFSPVIPAEGSHFSIPDYFGPEGEWEGPGTKAYQIWHASDPEDQPLIQSELTPGPARPNPESRMIY
jgi:hypothetical protein